MTPPPPEKQRIPRRKYTEKSTEKPIEAMIEKATKKPKEKEPTLTAIGETVEKTTVPKKLRHPKTLSGALKPLVDRARRRKDPRR